MLKERIHQYTFIVTLLFILGATGIFVFNTPSPTGYAVYESLSDECTYESGGCNDINKWCYNNKCLSCSSGYYNCDDLKGCESTTPCEEAVAETSTTSQKNSCKDSCGSKSKTGDCYCDAACVGFKDCCSDYEEVCGGTVTKCTDSDGGKDYYVKGTAYGPNTNSIYNYVNLPDNCYGPNSALTEFYCENGQTTYDYYECPNGCKDGVCIKSITTTKPNQPIDLSNYPKMFIKDNKFNGYLVVGDKASADNVIALSQIAVGLQYAGVKIATGTTVQKIDVDTTKLASQIDDPYKLNIISVGPPCSSVVSSQLMGNPADCTKGFTKGKGIIKLYNYNGYAQIVVAGYSDQDTRRAAKVLANYKDYIGKLKGYEVEVTGTSLSLSDINVGPPSTEEAEEEIKVNTCKDSCGSKSKTGNCYCDTACVKYGDCCSDYQEVCGGEETKLDFTSNCKDFDGGINYYKAGNLQIYGKDGISYTVPERCIDANTLEELYCNYWPIKNITYTCPNGCKNGVCIEEEIVSSCSLPSGIACLDFKVTPSTVEVVIKNGLSYGIILEQIQIPSGGCLLAKDTKISKGGTYTAKLSGCNNGQVASQFKSNIKIIYTKLEQEHMYGNLSAKVESETSPTITPTTSKNTCQNSCGSKSKTGSCYCDSACVTYGDCCADIDTYC